MVTSKVPIPGKPANEVKIKYGLRETRPVDLTSDYILDLIALIHAVEDGTLG